MAGDDLIGSVEFARIVGVDPSTVTRWVEKKIIQHAAKAPGKYGAFLFTRAEAQRIVRQKHKGAA